MIKKSTYIEDLVEDYPELVIPLKNHGVVCIACGEPVWGTLGEQMNKKGIENQDKIIDEMNKLINKG